jgi:hypothetical protein
VQRAVFGDPDERAPLMDLLRMVTPDDLRVAPRAAVEAMQTAIHHAFTDPTSTAAHAWIELHVALALRGVNVMETAPFATPLEHTVLRAVSHARDAAGYGGARGITLFESLVIGGLSLLAVTLLVAVCVLTVLVLRRPGAV